MSKKWVSSDHHWFHGNIIKHCHRPFINNTFPEDDERHWDVPTMNRVMVERWNSVVAPNDIVYYGGDMFYKGRTKDCEAILDQLNGQIYFVKGNHDKLASKFQHRYRFWGDLLEIKYEGHLIVLCHYAMRTWNKALKGSYHVYGHSHGQLPEDPNSLSFDIGVDCWNFYPVSVDRILEKMREKEAARDISTNKGSD
jgi:calcineurin-like phosphoesterase family protein